MTQKSIPMNHLTIVSFFLFLLTAGPAAVAAVNFTPYRSVKAPVEQEYVLSIRDKQGVSVVFEKDMQVEIKLQSGGTIKGAISDIRPDHLVVNGSEVALSEIEWIRGWRNPKTRKGFGFMLLGGGFLLYMIGYVVILSTLGAGGLALFFFGFAAFWGGLIFLLVKKKKFRSLKHDFTIIPEEEATGTRPSNLKWK